MTIIPRQQKTPPKLDLVGDVQDRSLKEILKGVEIEERDFEDFLKCVKIIELATTGMKMKDACEQCGVESSHFYGHRWRELMSKARRVVAARVTTMSLEPVAQRVFDEWPDVVNELISVAKTAPRELDRVKAAELLYEMYVKDSKTTEKDTSAESDYLKKPKNFNPMQPIIHVEAGATLNINQEKIIDVTPSEDDVAAS